jgi:hypothetical protein
LAGISPNATHKEGKAIIQVASLFNQLLQHFPRTEFGALVKKTMPNDAPRAIAAYQRMLLLKPDDEPGRRLMASLLEFQKTRAR